MQLAENVKDYIVESGERYIAYCIGKKDLEQVRIEKLLKESNPFKQYKEQTIGQELSTPDEKGEDMKYIRKRKDGRWEYRRTINCRRVSVIKRTLSELQKEIKQINAQKRVKSDPQTLEHFVREWYNTYKANLSEKTRANYHITLENYIIKKFGKKKPYQLNENDIQIFINSIPGLRIRELVCQHFKAILEYMYAKNLLKIDISKLIKNQKTVAEQQQKVAKLPLTISEQKQLLNKIQSCDLEFKLFIIFSIVLGTRRNETLAFKLKDINGDNLVVHGTKTESASRTIKISETMVKELQKLNRRVDEKYFKYSDYTITKKVDKMLQNINRNLTLHCLRKTCSTNMHYLEIPDKIRQQVLGHRSIKTTNDIYTHLEYGIEKKDINNMYNTLYYKY